MTDSGSDHIPAPLDLVPLPGSERSVAPTLTPSSVGLAGDTVIEATVILRRRGALSAEDTLGAIRSSAQLAAEFGADPADVSLVESTLRSLGLDIVSADPASRRIRISGA